MLFTCPLSIKVRGLTKIGGGSFQSYISLLYRYIIHFITSLRICIAGHSLRWRFIYHVIRFCVIYIYIYILSLLLFFFTDSICERCKSPWRIYIVHEFLFVFHIELHASNRHVACLHSFFYGNLNYVFCLRDKIAHEISPRKRCGMAHVK